MSTRGAQTLPDAQRSTRGRPLPEPGPPQPWSCAVLPGPQPSPPPPPPRVPTQAGSGLSAGGVRPACLPRPGSRGRPSGLLGDAADVQGGRPKKLVRWIGSATLGQQQPLSWRFVGTERNPARPRPRRASWPPAAWRAPCRPGSHSAALPTPILHPSRAGQSGLVCGCCCRNPMCFLTHPKNSQQVAS